MPSHHLVGVYTPATHPATDSSLNQSPPKRQLADVKYVGRIKDARLRRATGQLATAEAALAAQAQHIERLNKAVSELQARLGLQEVTIVGQRQHIEAMGRERADKAQEMGKLIQVVMQRTRDLDRKDEVLLDQARRLGQQERAIAALREAGG